MKRVALLDELTSPLKTEVFGRTCYGYEKIDSTNTKALELGRQGAPEGTLVYAEHQTAGRGRYGRRWEDAAGKNLLFSLILRPPFALHAWSLLPLMASVSLAETLDYVISPLVTHVKWPNDVLINGRKVAGILMESELSGSTDDRSFLVLGIGVNVNQVIFPEYLEEQATSLILEKGQFIPRAPLLARILLALEQSYKTLQSPGGDRQIRERFLHKMVHLGKEIQLLHRTKAQILTGTLVGITPEGALRLTVDGKEKVFHSGEITHHDQQSR